MHYIFRETDYQIPDQTHHSMLGSGSTLAALALQKDRFVDFACKAAATSFFNEPRETLMLITEGAIRLSEYTLTLGKLITG